MDNHENRIEKHSVKSKSRSEFSFKEIRTNIDYVILKENLSPKKEKTLTSKSRNTVKIYLGNDKKSVDNLMKTAVSLVKNNSKLNNLARDYRVKTLGKEKVLYSVNDKLDTEVYFNEGLKIKLSSTYRETKKLENKIKDKVDMSNNLNKNLISLEDKVKLFEQTVSTAKQRIDDKRNTYKENIKNLEHKINCKREKCSELENFNKTLYNKIGELVKKEKKLQIDLTDEYKLLKEKSLIDTALIDDLIVKLEELNKEAYSHQIYFDKNFTLDVKTGKYKEKNNNILNRQINELNKQNKELKGQVKNLKLSVSNITASSSVNIKSGLSRKNQQTNLYTTTITSPISSRSLNHFNTKI